MFGWSLGLKPKSVLFLFRFRSPHCIFAGITTSNFKVIANIHLRQSINLFNWFFLSTSLDFQKAAALVHEFLLKLSEDTECAELRDALNLALLHMQRYYRFLRNRMNQDKATNGSILTQSLRGLSPMTPFKDAPDKFQWKWINLDSPKIRGTLPVELSTEFSTLPDIIVSSKCGDNNNIMHLVENGKYSHYTSYSTFIFAKYLFVTC